MILAENIELLPGSGVAAINLQDAITEIVSETAVLVDVSEAPVIGATITFTANDCAPTAAQLVNRAVFAVPTTAAASTVTLPVTNVPDGTRVTFVANGTVNGHTVTYRETPTTAISAAATASKRHHCVCTLRAGAWSCSLSMSP